jgi:hypothetical protein
MPQKNPGAGAHERIVPSGQRADSLGARRREGQVAQSIEENAQIILKTLAERPSAGVGAEEVPGEDLAAITGLSPDRINDAVAILVDAGFVEWLQELGTAPYLFSVVWITPRGRYEYERLMRQPPPGPHKDAQMLRPPSPVGSPYGFTPDDWEIVSARKGARDVLHVVLGHQWESEYFDSSELRRHVEGMFLKVINEYQKLPGSLPVQLDFQSLAAGYGEHLFNKIARDLIGADIAVFETSDLNPNVMLEMGVALTWGVQVLPIKLAGCPKPPSDISGQTWADYQESARIFVDPHHEVRLLEMIKYAIRRKGRSS